MIDTDKYEGHDTGWKAHFFEDGSIGIGGVCKLLTEETGHKTRKMIEANALLIQDAPLLLERVIHLEHILKCAKDVLTNIYTYDKDLEDAEWIAWFCDMEDVVE